MDIKNYISSGIIDSYVMGTVSDQERREVECMAHIYPEIKDELTRLQLAIEQMAMGLAQNPPEGHKEKVIAEIRTTAQEQDEENTSNEVKVIPLYAKFAIAASFALLVAVGVMYNKSVSLEDQNLALAEGMKTLEDKNDQTESELTAVVDSTKSELDAQQQLVASLSDSSTVKIAMGGTEFSPESRVDVFWNKNSEDVLIKVQNLPVAPNGKQYQLWAIVDGKPTDMGVFDLASNGEVKSMPFKVKSPQAFAITLEKEGGSPVPTLEAMVTVGTV